MKKEIIAEKSFNEDDRINFKKEISYYLFFWPWFLLTMVMAITSSYLYLRYTPNIYQSNAQVQITKSDASSSFLTSEVTSLFGTRVNVQNDISVTTSNHILGKVVKKLDLQTSITELGRIKSSLVFGDELPFYIKFKNQTRPQKWNISFNNDSISISNQLNTYKLKKNEQIENNHFYFKINDSLLLNNKNYIIKNEIMLF
jgi:uncharacterized protein involved in exopolysaccharide biosynthesis